MNLTLIQHNIIWANKSENFRNIEKLFVQQESFDSDIIILPEMFSTGFPANPELLAEYSQKETYEWMATMAANYNAAVCGSYIIREGKNFLNRWHFVRPDGTFEYYDKRHLFKIGGEEGGFITGSRREVFIFRGVRILPSVCYDLRFPVWLRNRNDYDLLINSANWPAARNDVWLTLLKARAMENVAYVAGCNRVGTDPSGIIYTGDSIVFSPYGSIIVTSGNNEGIKTCTISINELNEIRNKFPALNDADNFTLI
jgi:predicted amidohydrolase